MTAADRTPEIPRQYLLSEDASEPRTLIDILHATAAATPTRRRSTTVRSSSPTPNCSPTSTTASPGSAHAASAAATGSESGCRRAATRCTSRSWPRCATGAAYVPVDADDPQERADLVFTRGGRRRGDHRHRVIVADRGRRAGARERPPADADDDAWIIFTSGSTGTPKGVAVTHRNAAAFVDAEAKMFLQDDPLGPGDRVLAGLSVAFDASCEEMWLAWRHGACLVPAPRSLVRSGMDLGPWLVARDVTVVSTVPTLASLWPAEALEAVRLLIFGGEACPPELAERLAAGPDSAAARCGTPTAPPRRRSSRALPGSMETVRSASGCHSTAGTWPSSTRPGPAGADRRSRRTRHRRCRPGPLPRPREGRREVRTAPHRAHSAGNAPTAVATSSGSSPTACSSWAAPTIRSRSAAPHRTGRGRHRAGEPARASAAVPRRCARRPAAPRCWSATSR